MSADAHGMPLVRRIMAEHRRLVIPLVALLAVNSLVYVVAVYPLAQRVANIEQRERAADQELAAARRDFDAARGALVGKERASTELTTFYSEILPSDLAGARRLTYLRLAQLARESGLRYERSTREPVSERGSTLTRLQIEMVLSGDYDSMRNFIYQLENAPEFVVIDDVGLAEGALEGSGLQLTLKLSTYYREEARP